MSRSEASPATPRATAASPARDSAGAAGRPSPQPGPVLEIHHRVKNNLQTVASLLRLQMRRADSPSAKEALADSIRRVEGMAIVHDLLARSGADAVDVRALARRLLDSAIAFAELPGQAISGRVDGELTLSGDRATHVALVLNELVANALKHAFRGRDRGHLAVHLVSAGDCFSCVVRDDGVGLGPDAHSGLGLSIARSIAEGELGGTLVFESDGGTRVTLRAPSGG